MCGFLATVVSYIEDLGIDGQPCKVALSWTRRRLAMDLRTEWASYLSVQ